MPFIVVVVTHLGVAAGVVRECAALGIGHAWVHCSFGTRGAYSGEVVWLGRRALPS